MQEQGLFKQYNFVSTWFDTDFALVYWIRIFLNQQNSDIPIYKVDTNKNEIALLTFDISYNERNIDEILEVLDKYDVKATFFVGNWIDENKDVVKKYMIEGMK